jgi:hypothetical protein
VSNASGRVSGLTNNTLYYFAVTAVKDGVEGSQSAMVTATSPIGSPSLDNLSDKYLILNSDITAFAFNNTNSAASSCSSEPSLPSGLIVGLASGSCEISGAPTVLQGATTYTIRELNQKPFHWR